MTNASTDRPAEGMDGFHLASCFDWPTDRPASDGCARDCPRFLLAEVERLGAERDSLSELVDEGTMSFVRSQVALKADNDRLRAAILRHRALVRNGPAWSTANRSLWSVLDDGDV